ncbi:MAG: ATP-dependent DNA helicase, partial [Anaerolineae bacterium]
MARRTPLDAAALSAMLEEGGAFSRAFEGFEHRPQQVEMLCAVVEALNESRHLLVEAGTGVGKSMAYLLPAIHWAAQNGERVVVSTNTINLQDQLIGKDIPDLRALLPFEVRAALLKGRSNYLCLRRLRAFQERLERAGTPAEDELTVLAQILAWLTETSRGDRSELMLYGARAQEVWGEVSADANACTGTFCPFFRQKRCFFYAAREAAESAHLIVVNHALLLSDVATENRVLPAYNYLIVDEAHHLESATTYQLGHAMTQRSISSLLDRVGHHESPAGGYLGTVLGRCQGRVPEEWMGQIEESVRLLYECIGSLIHGQRDLFEDIAAFVSDQLGKQGPYDQRLRLSRELRLLPEWEQIEVLWANQSDDLETTIAELAHLLDVLRDLADFEIVGHADLVQDGTAHLRQLGTVYAHLESVLMSAQDENVSWIRTRAHTRAGKRGSSPDEVSLCAVPLRVDDLVEQHLLWPKEAVIFTSATLRTSGDFSFIRERLGARDAQELAVGSPFDYESQVLLYLPTDIPEPNEVYYQQRMN